MKLIVFLGNPGNQYHQTRHNAGFLFGDFLRKKWQCDDWHYDKKFLAEMLTTVQKEQKIIFLKPQTFMNLSGESVGKVANFFQINPEEILVIHDDKDLKFGEIRFRKKGSSGGHRGIESIIQYLGRDSFARLKIGIEQRQENSKIDTASFVLSRFTEDELKQLSESIFLESEKILENWL